MNNVQTCSLTDSLSCHEAFKCIRYTKRHPVTALGLSELDTPTSYYGRPR